MNAPRECTEIPKKFESKSSPIPLPPAATYEDLPPCPCQSRHSENAQKKGDHQRAVAWVWNCAERLAYKPSKSVCHHWLVSFLRLFFFEDRRKEASTRAGLARRVLLPRERAVRGARRRTTGAENLLHLRLVRFGFR